MSPKHKTLVLAAVACLLSACPETTTRKLEKRQPIAAATSIVTIRTLAGQYPQGTRKRPIVVGHRGSAGTHAENTMAAFREGSDAGSDRVELDVHLTSDQTLVLSHDPLLEGPLCRDANGNNLAPPVAIHTSLLKDLTPLDCGTPPEKEAPPTFEAFLNWQTQVAPQTKFIVHVKEGDDTNTIVGKVVSALNAHGAAQSAFIMAFEEDIVAAAAKMLPGVTTGLFMDRTKAFCDRAKAANVAIAAPISGLVTPAEVQHCHDLGLQVYAWTVIDDHTWKEMLNAGVDGLITDFPRKLEKYLSTQNFAP